MILGRFAILVFFAVAFIGCVEGKSYVSANKNQKVAKNVLKKPPEKIDHPTDANFDGKVILLGYDLEKDLIQPDGYVEVTWYWKVKETPGPGWRLFTHMLNADGKSKVNRDKVGIVRKNFQPEHWKSGMIIKDTQRLHVPKSWKSDFVELRTGLWKGDSRMPGTGKSIDMRNRVQGPRVRVRQTKMASIAVPRAPSVPVIDGEFENEDAWKGAVELGAFAHTMTGDPVSRATTVRMMWDDKNLYVAMRAVDDYLKTRFTKHDDEVWKEDAFEVFLDPLGDKKDYYELQVSPAGVVFDSYLPAYRKNRNEWTSKMVAKVTTDGKVNDDSDKDKGWTAELAIPFASLNKGGGVPPQFGSKWRVNFFRVDITTKKPRYSAWSPPLRGDFHALDKFGEIVFQGPQPAGQAAEGKASIPKTTPKAAKGDKKSK
ncbi:MAG: hypothetical protein GY854_11090 [Deltaproteobacteria bacterium]|nr:hypothetical protein [Deltaproteobacteria bacterium]